MLYKSGQNFIVQDIDSHTGGFSKMASSIRDLQSKTTRRGTHDILLQRIGD